MDAVDEANTHREMIKEFYAALCSADANRIAAVSGRVFAADAVLTLPESLPYGGVRRGVDALGKLFSSLAHPRSPIDPSAIAVERLVANRDQVIAELSFVLRVAADGAPLSMRNVEWFVFRDGAVSEMTVFYFDTARCLEALAGGLA